MNLVEAPYRGRLGHELPNAFVKGAVDEQIGAGDGSATFVVEGRPFAKNSRRIEVDVSVGTGHPACPFPRSCCFGPLCCAGRRDFSALEVAGAMAKGEGWRRPGLDCRLARLVSNLPSLFPSALDWAQRNCFGGMRAR
jgi:hypothetical protein